MRIDIDGTVYDLTCTCEGCPEQYDVHRGGEQVGYLRLRGGEFEARTPDVQGPEVYTAEPKGDGMFEDDERDGYLEAAVRAIHEHRAGGGTEYRWKERDRIAIDHRTCGGQPRIEGTRVTVAHVLRMLAGGETPEVFAGEHPGIELADVLDCLDYAAWVLEGEDG